MVIKTIFSGFGGQGVMSMGQTLARAAMLDNRHVTYLPAYGTEMRGGTANCTVTVADEEIASPIASEPEFVVAMNQPSFQRFQSIIQSGGFLLYNSSLVEANSERGDVEFLGVPTVEIANELGNARAANMVMLGAFIKVSNIIPLNILLKHLPELLGKGKAKLLKINEKAIQAGYDYIKEQSNAD